MFDNGLIGHMSKYLTCFDFPRLGIMSNYPLELTRGYYLNISKKKVIDHCIHFGKIEYVQDLPFDDPYGAIYFVIKSKQESWELMQNINRFIDYKKVIKFRDRARCKTLLKKINEDMPKYDLYIHSIIDYLDEGPSSLGSSVYAHHYMSIRFNAKKHEVPYDDAIEKCLLYYYKDDAVNFRSIVKELLRRDEIFAINEAIHEKMIFNMDPEDRIPFLEKAQPSKIFIKVIKPDDFYMYLVRNHVLSLDKYPKGDMLKTLIKGYKNIHPENFSDVFSHAKLKNIFEILGHVPKEFLQVFRFEYEVDLIESLFYFDAKVVLSSLRFRGLDDNQYNKITLDAINTYDIGKEAWKDILKGEHNIRSSVQEFIRNKYSGIGYYPSILNGRCYRRIPENEFFYMFEHLDEILKDKEWLLNIKKQFESDYVGDDWYQLLGMDIQPRSVAKRECLKKINECLQKLENHPRSDTSC